MSLSDSEKQSVSFSQHCALLDAHQGAGSPRLWRRGYRLARRQDAECGITQSLTVPVPLLDAACLDLPVVSGRS